MAAQIQLSKGILCKLILLFRRLIQPANRSFHFFGYILSGQIKFPQPISRIGIILICGNL